MYAVIQTGGKQYRVQPDDVIFVEKIDKANEEQVSFDALMVANGDAITVGTPTVAGVSVTAKILGQVKGDKVLVYKYRSKKNSRRIKGHRQPYTKLQIVSVNG